MAKKLHYFHVNGLAEPIRYILHYTKQEFEDIRHDHGSWPITEIKNKLPYGQLPIYEEGERVLTQSLAIAKYVARGTDLIPLDPWQRAVLEATAYTIYDCWSKISAYIKENDPQKKKEMKEELLEETIDFFFSRLEKHLNENGGYFSGKLSWVEFVLTGLVEAANLFLDTEVEKKYPAIKAVVEKIRNLPGVKEYIAARGPYEVKKFYNLILDCLLSKNGKPIRENHRVDVIDFYHLNEQADIDSSPNSSQIVIVCHSISPYMMAKKLHYFPSNGLAEPIRYILHYTKQEFEEIKHDHGTWHMSETRKKLPYGLLPMYEEGERILTQSMAITKYVASGTDLMPQDPWQRAVLEATAYTISDCWSKLIAYVRVKDPEKKEEMKEELLEETIDFFFSRFEKHLIENGGYFNGKLSWVEFLLTGLVEAGNRFLDTELEKKYPAIKAVVEKIRNVPGVK